MDTKEDLKTQMLTDAMLIMNSVAFLEKQINDKYLTLQRSLERTKNEFTKG